MRIVLALLAGMITFVVSGCGNAPVAGGGTETTNGGKVACVIVDTAGRGVVGATVTVRPAGYVSGTPAALAKSGRVIAGGVTDAEGGFVIDSLDTGTYAIEVNDGRTAAVLLFAAITHNRDSADLGTGIIRNYAVVAGTVDTTGYTGVSRFVQVYGLERLVPVAPGGSYRIADLPAGVLRLRIVADDTGITRPVTVDSVVTTPGVITTVPMAGWRFSRRIMINTTATGANVTDDVTGFPLLVRLDASVLDFAQAQDSGRDVRFTNANGLSLPYEIEQWDGAAKKAAIWVLMDTVQGNSAAQSITMHWGAPAGFTTSSASNGATVFDTAAGWVGVWHLSEHPVADSMYAIRDATQNRSDGFTMGGMGGTNLVGGAVGLCLNFDGIDDYVHTDPSRYVIALGTSDLSVSAWFFTSRDTANQGIVSVEGMERFRLMSSRLGGVWYGMYSDSTWVDTRGGPISVKGEWHHLTTSFNRGGYCRLYLDGAQVDSLDVSVKNGVSFDSVHFSIGQDHYAIPSMFMGMIDEARVMRRAVSAAWVRLNYMNQKQNDALIAFP